MSESYSDIWKRRHLEQRPEIVGERETDQAACSESILRAYPLPATTRPVPQLPSVPCLTPEAPRQARNIPFQRSQAHLAVQHRETYQSTRELVSATCELRYQLRLTQRAFAEELGINPRTWQEWEQGRRLPTGPGKALLEQWIARHHEL